MASTHSVKQPTEKQKPAFQGNILRGPLVRRCVLRHRQDNAHNRASGGRHIGPIHGDERRRREDVEIPSVSLESTTAAAPSALRSDRIRGMMYLSLSASPSRLRARTRRFSSWSDQTERGLMNGPGVRHDWALGGYLAQGNLECLKRKSIKFDRGV